MYSDLGKNLKRTLGASTLDFEEISDAQGRIIHKKHKPEFQRLIGRKVQNDVDALLNAQLETTPECVHGGELETAPRCVQLKPVKTSSLVLIFRHGSMVYPQQINHITVGISITN